MLLQDLMVSGEPLPNNFHTSSYVDYYKFMATYPATMLLLYFSVGKSGQCPSILKYAMPSLHTPSVIKSSVPSSPPLVLKHSTQYPCTPTVVRSSALSLCSQEQCAIPTHSHHTWECYTALLFLYMARCCSILKNTTNCQPLM